MPRPAVAAPAQVRSAVFALLAQAGLGQAPSAQSFRRAVSVRKVREHLGGGNPATIGREVNAVEAEIVQAGLDQLALPEIPADIAELMQQLWRAAVGVQLEQVARLRTEAQALAEGSREQLAESLLRTEMLKQELGEQRAALADRDARLAQALTDGAGQARQLEALRQELQDSQARAAQLATEKTQLQQAQTEAIAAAQARYEGLSRRLLEETGQQRQAAQAELARLGSQLKAADKRQTQLEARLQQQETDLTEARGEREQALGEATALRYVNTSLRGQLEDLVRSLPAAALAPVRGRKRPARKSA